jgi:MFS family permease
MVVMMQERGLSLTTIGLLWAVQGVVVLVLELPTGGLADAAGRRPVLLGAGTLSLAATIMWAFAGSVTWFVVAMAVDGIYRALESGPLESWYVDASQAADPHADIESGLARKGLVLGVAIAVGALIGGGLALVPQPGALPVLALPVLVSAAMRFGDLAALAALLVEVRPRPAGRAVARSEPGAGTTNAATAPAGGAVATIAGAMRLLRASPALVALAAVEMLWGAGMTGVELLSAPRMVELVGDARSGIGAIAVAGAVAWSISGVGANLAPWLARITGSWVGAAIVTRIVQGAAVAAAAVVAGPTGLLTAYLGFYLVHGAANVAHYGLVHRNVGPEHRATMVSVNSLTSRVGGTVAGPVLGAVATAAGIPAAFGVGAVLLALPAPLYLVARNRPDPSPPPPEAVARGAMAGG